MKLPITIDGEQFEITLTEEQVASLEAQKKLKKFEWKYSFGKTYGLEIDFISTNNHGNYKNMLEHGRYRLTKETAEQSLARNKRANRLEALAEQLGGLVIFNNHSKEADKSGFDSSMQIFMNGNGTWNCKASSDYSPEVVYMTIECAIEICRMLNEMEFSLEGEL